jgi:tetratricopeptide (TPR) repeat protein
MGLEKFGEAQIVVAKISAKGDEISAREDWGGGTAFLANKLLNEIITAARIAGVEMKAPPDVLLKAAAGKKSLRQWAAAVRGYQGVISSSETPEEIDEFAKTAWMEIGECYYRSEKFFEAYFTYDRIEKEFDGQEIAGDAAYYRYRAITARHVETKDPRDLALKKKARADFATKYKDHPRSIDLQYYEGADLISDADSARAGGKQEAADAAYNEALSRLLNTKKSSILYSKAQARIGEVFYKQKKYPEALKKFAAVFKFVKDPKNPTTDPQRQANRLQAEAIATFFSARCHKETKDWTKVIETLDGYEKRFEDENVRNFHAPVKFERMRAFIQIGKFDEAETQALAMRDEWPAADQLPLAFSMLSRAKSDGARKAKEAGNNDEWSKLLTKAAEYYTFYLKLRGERNPEKKPTWQEHQLIGYWYFDLGDMPSAEPNLEISYTILLGVIDKTPEGERKENLKSQADGLLQKLSEILLRQKKFGEAKEKLEKLLVPDPAARVRVLELLKAQELSKVALQELMDKIRAIPSLMEGLARTYKAVGGPDDLLRALTLVKLLYRADPKNKYTKVGWDRKYLMCEIYLQYGRDFRDEAALDNVIKLVTDWESLGVLKNSGMEQKFKQIRSDALALKR